LTKKIAIKPEKGESESHCGLPRLATTAAATKTFVESRPLLGDGQPRRAAGIFFSIIR
jgi:hypothetical protein